MIRETDNPHNSRPFDVHTWSDHPEVNDFLDDIFNLLPDDFESQSNRKGTPTKRVLKVLLLDLFVVWKEDPTKWIGISLSEKAYSSSRYNALHLSKKTLRVVHALNDLGLLDWLNHSHSKTNPRGNRTTRIRASDRLQEMFAQAALEEDWVRLNEQKEVIILRDKDEEDPGQDSFDKDGAKKRKTSKNIEYDDAEFPAFLDGAREDLRAYNDLLNGCHIDIASLDEPRFDRTDDQGRTKSVHLHQGRHFVRRVFSRGSFHCNGRFYGGWWQNCPKQYRKYIRINRQPTVEVDYSAMHPLILAAEKGLVLEEDPYVLAQSISNEVSDQLQRKLVKAFLLTAINAANPDQAYKAFRYKFSAEFDLSLTRNLFDKLHQGFIETHPALEDSLFSDQGIRLMNIDSQIAARIISGYVTLRKPILSVHDSFIVPKDDVEGVEFAMEKVSEAVLGVPLKFKRHKQFLSIDQLPPQHLDRDAYHRAFEGFVDDFTFSPAYDQRWREWEARRFD